MRVLKHLACGGLAALVATNVAAQTYAPPDPALVPVAPGDRLTAAGIFLDADPVVKLILAALLIAALVALVVWIKQGARRTATSGALGYLSAQAAAAPLIGFFGSAYTLMNSMLALSNLRPAPTISVVAPGLAEALASAALGLLAAAIAVMAHRHLNARLQRVASEAEVPAASDSPAVNRLVHQPG